jgi:hypothetical protein
LRDIFKDSENSLRGEDLLAKLYIYIQKSIKKEFFHKVTNIWERVVSMSKPVATV